jgi:hypothetical protein
MTVNHHQTGPGFWECDSCAAKCGQPPLCQGCLHNREVIGAFMNAKFSDDAALRAMAKEIADNNPMICGPCGGPLPNPDCGHKANGSWPCCVPVTDNLEDAIFEALCRVASTPKPKLDDAMRHRAMEKWAAAAHHAISREGRTLDAKEIGEAILTGAFEQP